MTIIRRPKNDVTKKLKMFAILMDGELAYLAHNKTKIEVLDRNDFITEEIKIVPCEVKLMSKK